MGGGNMKVIFTLEMTIDDAEIQNDLCEPDDFQHGDADVHEFVWERFTDAIKSDKSFTEVFDEWDFSVERSAEI